MGVHGDIFMMASWFVQTIVECILEKIPEPEKREHFCFKNELVIKIVAGYFFVTD